MGKDLYALLGGSKVASADEIRAAYRRQARRLHPDVNTAPDAQERFAELQNAYGVLSDDDRRAFYDRTGRTGNEPPRASSGAGRAHYSWSNVAGSPGGGPPGGGSPFGFDDDVASAFETFFSSRGSGFGQGRRASPKRPRGKDVRATLEVPFATAAIGGTAPLRITRGGQQTTIEVRIPAAIADDATLRLKGQGEPPPATSPGAAPGDLLVTLRIKPHPVLRPGAGPTADPGADPAASLDLWLELPLTPAEAVFGARLDVPTPGGAATLVVPPGTSGGARLRLKDRGRTRDGRTGHLYAHIRVRVPTPDDLSQGDRKALERLSSHVDPGRSGAGWPG